MKSRGLAFLGSLFAVAALAGGCQEAIGRDDAPAPLARIAADTSKVVIASGCEPTRSGDIHCATSAVGPAALVFGPGGKLAWESASLLAGPRGSVTLEFNYSPLSAYNRDLPVLVVADTNNTDIFKLTIGRVMLKISGGAHAFATDLYLNEAENSWLRTSIAWEKIGRDRMLLRTTINDRVYDSAIVPAFPGGDLRFTVGPEGISIREIAFYDRPLPRDPFAHKCRRAPAAGDGKRVEIMRGFISRSEQAALDGRGGVVLLVPDGALSRAMPRGLRILGLGNLRVVNDSALKPALSRAAVLILPDSDGWSRDRSRERAIADFVRGGGGLLALGASAAEVGRMQLVEFAAREAGCEGYVPVEVKAGAAALKEVCAKPLFGGNVSLDLLMRRGPLFSVPASMSNAVAAIEPFTGLSCALAVPCGKGRVALASVAPFGYYFWNPTFETIAGVSDNAARFLFFKSLLFYAAGLPITDAAPGEDWPDAALAPAASGAPATVTASLDLGRRGGKKGALFQNLAIGPAGSVSFWLKADTLNLAGPGSRNLVWLSDGGENTLQLYYSPADQFLVLKGSSPNGEEVVYANERTTWTGRDWRHVAFTWQATSMGDAAVEIFIDGVPAASGALPLPLRPLDRMILGDSPGMPGLDMEARDLVLGADPSPDFAEVRRLAAPPHSWEDTPEDRAELDRFNSSCRVAILGDTHPNHWKTFRSYDLCGIKCDVLMQKDLAGDALEKRKYAVIVAPGGGPPPYADPQGMRDRIRNHVRSGLGYVGICAGMIEAAASASPATTLCLYEAPIKSFGGTQLVDVRLRGRSPVISGVTAAFCDGSGEPSVRFVHMSGPPVPLKGLRSAEEAVALMGMAPDCGAAISFKYGAGQGIVWAPHPELDGWGWWRPSDRTRYVMRKLLRNSIYHASGWRR